MKIKNLQSIPILLLLLLGSIILSCEKDNEECDDNCSSFSQSDNMVGYLQPRQAENDLGLLYYSPGLLPNMLEQLGAVEVDPGFYQMTMPLLDGTEEELLFQATEVEQPALYANSSGLAGELRVPHTVYIDAQCDIVADIGIDTLGFDETLNRYVIQEITKAYGECVDGDDFCLTIEQIFGQRRYYVDDDYGILVATEDLKHEVCTQ